MKPPPTFEERRQRHVAAQQQFARDAEGAEKLENRLSILRLVLFLLAAAAVTSGLSGAGTAALWVGAALLLGFVGAVVYHSRVVARKERARAREAVHTSHMERMDGGFVGTGRAELLPGEHDYAADIDLAGEQSLLSRIDTTHTRRGAEALVRCVSGPTRVETARQRQQAVRELSEMTALRRELEVAASRNGRWDKDLDDRPFLEFTRLPSLFAQHAWLKPVVFVLPLCTLTGVLLSRWGGQSFWLWLAPLLAQLGLLRWSSAHVHRALDWITARLGFAEALRGMLEILERAELQSPLLRQLQHNLQHEGVAATVHLRRLERYEGLAQLRTQGPVYLVVNALTLWDLFCLERLEHFNATVGTNCEAWFDALGELEALCSLSTLADVDPDACFPELAERGELSLEGAAHPLLHHRARVANDVELPGPGSVWVVTGSNMAGKSTLLRAVGLNIALALAGGPVVARRARVPWVRLRASMRIDDSLQRGASYFRAELNKLQRVVESLERDPPVFFLLDEVLRGTNSRARSVGARAVVRHLLEGSAFGLVATHDAGLATLQDDPRFSVHNCHFTDVFEGGEMRFDYRLRPGVVQSSNALRLLEMAGIAVTADETGESSSELYDGPH